MAYISQIKLSGTTYDIRDKGARQLISEIQSGGLSFRISSDAATTPVGATLYVNGSGSAITGTLQPSATTKPYIYLVHVQSAHDVAGGTAAKDVYEEWVTVDISTTSTPSYVWELLGNTGLSFDGLSIATSTDTFLKSFTATSETVGVTIAPSTSDFTALNAHSDISVSVSALNISGTTVTVTPKTYTLNSEAMTDIPLLVHGGTVADFVVLDGTTLPDFSSLYTLDSSSYISAASSINLFVLQDIENDQDYAGYEYVVCKCSTISSSNTEDFLLDLNTAPSTIKQVVDSYTASTATSHYLFTANSSSPFKAVTMPALRVNATDPAYAEIFKYTLSSSNDTAIYAAAPQSAFSAGVISTTDLPTTLVSTVGTGTATFLTGVTASLSKNVITSVTAGSSQKATAITSASLSINA